MFLDPSGYIVDVSFLDDLINHRTIKRFDRCTFIADYLVAGICAYKEGDKTYVCGCLHILHVNLKLIYCLSSINLFVVYLYLYLCMQLIYVDYVKYTDTKLRAPVASFPLSAHIMDTYLEYAANKAASVSLKVNLCIVTKFNRKNMCIFQDRPHYFQKNRLQAPM